MEESFKYWNEVAKKVKKLNDTDFTIFVGMIGFKRVLKVVEDWAKNYKQG